MLLHRRATVLSLPALLLSLNWTHSTELAAQANVTRTVTLSHNTAITVTGVMLGDGSVRTGVPQQLVYQEGTRVCLEVADANLVWYDYHLGKAEASLEPSSTELATLTFLADLLSKVASATSSGVAARVALAAKSFQDPEKDPQTGWLLEYAARRLQPLADTIKLVEDARNRSELPNQPSAPAGYGWARVRISELLTSARMKGLRADLKGWHDAARQARDARVAALKKELAGAANADSMVNAYLNWTDVVLDALQAYGVAIADRAERYSKEFSTPDTWQQCSTLGKNQLILSIGVKRKAEGTAARAVPDSQLIVTVTPRYRWPTVDLVTGLGVVVTPSAHAFAISDGKVEDDGDETLIRPMVSLSFPFQAFGDRGQNAWAIFAGASALDFLGREKGDNLLVHAGLGLRVGEVVSLSGGVTYGKRPIRLKGGAQVGQALPSGISALEDAIHSASKFGLFVQLAVKGFNLKN